MEPVFRKAVPRDLDAMMSIITQAQAFIKQQGLDQWQNGYPDAVRITTDIQNGYAYVMQDDAGVAAVAALIFDREPDYDHISDGHWGAADPYAAIHRVAIRQDIRGGGLARLLMENLETLCRAQKLASIRIDTHPGNLPMQRFLTKCGFTRRGTVFLSAGGGQPTAVRWAYDKLLAD